jgi:hypothetical protein
MIDKDERQSLVQVGVAILWVVLCAHAVLFGVLLIGMLFVGGGIPIGAAGMFASFPLLGTLMVGLGTLGVMAGRAYLKAKPWGTKGMLASLFLSLLVCVGSALAFWSWMGDDEWIVKVILLGIGPAAIVLFMWILLRHKSTGKPGSDGSVLECPDCGLESPKGSQRCDCGHPFR